MRGGLFSHKPVGASSAAITRTERWGLATQLQYSRYICIEIYVLTYRL